MPYKDLVDELAPLEIVPEQAFVGDAAFPQPVCNVVLALACIYNDFRDISLAHLLLAEVAPPRPTGTSRESGQFGATYSFLLRLRAGVAYELLYLLAKKKAAFKHSAFENIVAHVDKDAQGAWKAVASVGFNNPTSDPLANALLQLRNTVAFHYSPPVLKAGLANYLSGATDRKLFISKGGSMRSSRFYFADAAAEASIVASLSEPSVKEFFNYDGLLVRGFNRCLYQLVTRFIDLRGYPLQPYAPVV